MKKPTTKTHTVKLDNAHQQQIAFDYAGTVQLEGVVLVEPFSVRVEYQRFGSDVQRWSSFCYGLKKGFNLARYLDQISDDE